MKAVFWGFFVLQAFPLLLQFLQLSARHCGWRQPPLTFCPCCSLRHGWTRARGPGMTLSGVNSMSDQVQTQGLRLWSHQPYMSLEHCRNPNQHLPRSRFYTGFGRACLTGGKQCPEQKTPGTKSHFLGLKYSNQSR